MSPLEGIDIIDPNDVRYRVVTSDDGGLYLEELRGRYERHEDGLYFRAVSPAPFYVPADAFERTPEAAYQRFIHQLQEDIRKAEEHSARLRNVWLRVVDTPKPEIRTGRD